MSVTGNIQSLHSHIAFGCARSSSGPGTDAALDPQDGFVLSRINGEWDVHSILKMCPMTEQEVLIIFKRLVDDGLVEFQ